MQGLCKQVITILLHLIVPSFQRKTAWGIIEKKYCKKWVSFYTVLCLYIQYLFDNLGFFFLLKNTSGISSKGTKQTSQATGKVLKSLEEGKKWRIWSKRNNIPFFQHRPNSWASPENFRVQFDQAIKQGKSKEIHGTMHNTKFWDIRRNMWIDDACQSWNVSPADKYCSLISRNLLEFDFKMETQVYWSEVHFCSNLNTDINGLRPMLISCLIHDLKWRKLIYWFLLYKTIVVNDIIA